VTPTRITQSAGKFLYGLTFVVILPLLLFEWARLTEDVVHVPVAGSFSLGVAATLIGLAAIMAGFITLSRFGGGLPMNVYPPPRYVTRGIYRLLPHPIYVGFSVACVGISMACRSSGGLWLVSPIVALGCTALVQGFEKHDLVRRFGSPLPGTLLRLPSDEPRAPRPRERLSVYLLVFLPWLVLYESVVALGISHDAMIAYFPFEKNLPVYAWTEIFYGSTYPFVFLVPLVATSARDLREFAVAGIAATVLITLLFLVIPLVSPPREFATESIFGSILLMERSLDASVAAFPSFHVVWAFLAARVYARAIPSSRVIWWSLALLISASCITTGMHALVDVLAGALVVPLVLHTSALWEKVRSLTERIANSWKEWQTGRIRIINHGMYAAAGTSIGLLIIGCLLGPGSVGPMLIIACSSLITAALWAQFIEGSPSLLRPYGFYGGVIGVVLGSLIARLFGGDIWELLGAYAVVGPLIQSAGRLRCLVQGCCHGREAPAYIGIRYTHPRSRVCRLADMCNIPIHPTPLYSILWNVFVGITVARLWSLHASLSFIAGLYLVLNGIGRFVEEAYRGEPQTPIIGGLRLYQWMAIATVVSGAVLTTVRTSSAIPDWEFSWMAVGAAACFGVVTWFALGVDFPNSNKRFARLA
jgi:protein-S-isoprenylcysteine O-methyltransferase Ste14/membrane-associated phospholipid phosphatase